MPVTFPHPFRQDPASALCDELHAGGFFAALVVDASGEESLAYVPVRPRADVDANAAPILAELSHRFKTEPAFARGLSAYLRNAEAVYTIDSARPLAAA